MLSYYTAKDYDLEGYNSCDYPEMVTIVGQKHRNMFIKLA